MTKRVNIGVRQVRRAILATLGSVIVGGVTHRATAVEGATSAAATEGVAGQRRLTYSLSAAELWVADFGSAKLRNGRARIELSPGFLEVVNTGVPYHILVTPLGRTPGVYVAHRDATGFAVEEQAGGNGAVEFDYQVVAKQRGSEDQRLELFTPLPMSPPPTVPPVSPPPRPPEPEAPGSGGTSQ